MKNSNDQNLKQKAARAGVLPINEIICGDCLEVMKDWPDGCVETIITDPPYGLSFMGKKWDYDVPSIEIWQECLRVLKPGGTLLCFAGSRTQHRMAVNVEDAGFILKDCIMWIYGSGFPKATDISKQLDKGHERKVIGKSSRHGGGIKGAGTSFEVSPEIPDITAPATTEAQLWNGWKSHGLKPAYEPILVAMKPNDGTYANNALVHGVSGLNIDGGRIGTGDKLNGGAYSEGDPEHMWSKNSGGGGLQRQPGQFQQPQGRFPANIILDEEAGRMLDEQTQDVGNTKPHKVVSSTDSYDGWGTITKKSGEVVNYNEPNAKGASRFFYCAKASKKERNAGCEGLEKKQTTGGGGMNNTPDDVCGKYGSIKSAGHNHHPTVKPLALMEYLCTLTKTPIGGIVLDPFSGSGTTCKAAKNTGRDYIGIDDIEEYCQIARDRLRAIETCVPVKEARKGQMSLLEAGVT